MRSGMVFELQRTNSFEEVARVLQTVGKHKTTDSAAEKSNRIGQTGIFDRYHCHEMKWILQKRL